VPNAATGQCRKWNADIPALNGNGNFATTWQVSAAFFFIVFILAFVAFVMSLLERFVHLPSFVKGRVGLVYHSFIVVSALIAVIIGGVKFQEINKFVPLQSGVAAVTVAGTPSYYAPAMAVTGQSCLYFTDNTDTKTYVNLCSTTSAGFSTSVVLTTGFAAPSASNNIGAPMLSFWGFGLGVAVTSVVMAAFQLFVAFRHFAAESRAADTKGDGNAA